MPTERRAPSPRWFNVSVLGFGLASLFGDVGYEAATAALPALLTSLGAAAAALGIIEGAADGLSSVARLAGGWLADQPRRRKPMVVGGYLITALATGAFALASSWPFVLITRGVGWLARGMRGPPRDAMLADAVPEEARGRAFGFHRAMDSVGAVIGPAMALFVLSRASIRAVFAWSLLPGILAALSFAALVRRHDTPQEPEQRPLWTSIRGLPSDFRSFLLAAFLFGIGDFARTLLILRASELLAPELGIKGATSAAMILYIGHNALYAAASYPVGWVADRVSPAALLVGGYLLGVLTAVLAAVATAALWLLAILFTVAGLTLAFEDTLEGTITSHRVARELRGTGYGALAATNGVGDLISSAMVGVLWSAFGPRVGFGVAALFCLSGAIVLAASSRTEGK